ncbi:MAG: DUF2807 domain-containing protein [Bacteroidales bacterium]|nr:DUF2807 domain-containing protein [Bacteroidales bacterium]MBN2761956.1 DUF2807 domain-containing protein [Bacteroidales bacterium]
MKNLVLFAVVLSFSCNAPVMSGETIKETRQVDQFSSISLAISANVYLTQGSVQKIEIEGDKNSLAEIETVVTGDLLKIKTKSRIGGNLGKVNLYITVPEINGLNVAGSGDIMAKSVIKTDEMDMSVSGSGSIHLTELSVHEVSTTITGSGNIDIESGQAQSELDVVITGSGSFSGEGFSADEANVTITGSGNAKVWAVKELGTNITGSGSVSYKGNPLVNAISTGSGKTRAVQ